MGSEIRVRIVGCHGSVALGFRGTSYLLDETLLIDAGGIASGTHVSEQMKITDILLSHSHLDHISDLPFLADNCFGVKKEGFQIHLLESVRKTLVAHLFNGEISPDFTRLPSESAPILKFKTFRSEESFQVGDYRILPVRVNHPAGGHGFILEKNGTVLVFTQDTGPTERIWELCRDFKGIKGVFTEVSFPNALQSLATASRHHTAQTMKDEIQKMPEGVPLFLGHLKPPYYQRLLEEIGEMGSDRITVLKDLDRIFCF